METTVYKEVRLGEVAAENKLFFPDMSPESMIISLIEQSRTLQREVRRNYNKDAFDGTDLKVSAFVQNHCIVGVRFASIKIQEEAILNVARIYDALVVTDWADKLKPIEKRISFGQMQYGSKSYGPSVEEQGLSYDVVLLNNFGRKPMKAESILGISRQCHRHETFVIVDIQ